MNAVSAMLDLGTRYDQVISGLDSGTWFIYILSMLVALGATTIGLCACHMNEKRSYVGTTVFSIMGILFFCVTVFTVYGFFWTQGKEAQIRRNIAVEALHGDCKQFEDSIATGRVDSISFDNTHNIFRWCDQSSLIKASHAEGSRIEFKPVVEIHSSGKSGTTKYYGWVATLK